MKRANMNAMVGSELQALFPIGSKGSTSNQCRKVYNALRRHDLSSVAHKGSLTIYAETKAIVELGIPVSEWKRREYIWKQ